MSTPSCLSRRAVLGWLAAANCSVLAATQPAAKSAKKPARTGATKGAAKHAVNGAPRGVAGGTAVMDRINAATATPVLARGARNDAVLRAQVLLDRAWFSPGEIDGSFGTNMRRMLVAYQTSTGLPPSGRVDAATWKSLMGDFPDPVLEQYTLTKEDAAGPFAKTPRDMMERALLKSLPYESIEEALGERFHCSPGWLKSVNRGVAFEPGDRIVVPALGKETPPTKAASIRIDKSERVLYLLDTAEMPVAAFPISIGGSSDPLPLGRMEIKNAAKNPVFTYDPELLKNADKSQAKTDIRPGPNNPVGVYWLGLSKPHWGIHGTPEPSRVGTAETNGCIHMTNWDVTRLARVVKAGFVVDVHA